MRPGRLSLKSRFVIASLLLVSISTAGYFVAVIQFLEFLEAELLGVELVEEMDDFAHDYQRDPGAYGPHAAGLSSYVVPAGAADGLLPAPLRPLPTGLHDDIFIDGREVAVARADVNGARLYVVLDTEPLERLEERFIALAMACALASWLVAIALALWLAQRVMRPVSQLADRVREWHPGDHQRRLTPQFGDQEVGAIATAFDGFIERMAAFVAREQAFTEDASHELRTPLAVIDSASQLLADDPQLPPAARERVQRILRAVEQMRTLIEALLFLAREDEEYRSEELPVHQLVTEIADHHRAAVRAKRLELSISTVPTMLRAPRGMATCVIGNLLLNAIHYTERGRIEVRVEPGRLSVQDTGIGIPPQDLEHIFERRFRGTQSRGLGLGLYLVKRICDRLGWRVEVTSRSGQGTRFDVLFPPDQRNPNESPTLG